MSQDTKPQLVHNLVQFGRLLRRLGLPTTPAEMHTLTHALEAVSIIHRQDFKNAARAILVGRREHLPLFDQAFELFWTADALKPHHTVDLGRLLEPVSRANSQVMALNSQNPPTGEPHDLETTVIDRHYSYSARELLRRKDFADLSLVEEDQIRQLMREQQLKLAARRTRRQVPASNGSRLDLRASLRRALAHGGEPIELARRKRKEKRRPLVVLCDVSGSMELYSRLFLEFIYTLKTATDRLEAFVFGTRLTRITRQLQTRHVEQALRDATSAIVDWGGGTRIGESLKVFNFEWARRVLGQGSVVLVISDGWDRGDTLLLDREVGRLRRRCDRLIWLNPLLGSTGYEPLTRGIRTILPWTDDFLPVHNLESLEQLSSVLANLGRTSTNFGPTSTLQGGGMSPARPTAFN